jgi:hypothetical protein
MDKEVAIKLNELLGIFRAALRRTPLLVFSTEMCSFIFQSPHSEFKVLVFTLANNLHNVFEYIGLTRVMI